MRSKTLGRLAGAVSVTLLLIAFPAGAEITGVTFKTSRNVSFY